MVPFKMIMFLFILFIISYQYVSLHFTLCFRLVKFQCSTLKKGYLPHKHEFLVFNN